MTTNETAPGTGQELSNKHRRTFIGGALATLLASPRRVMAEDTDAPNNLGSF